MTPCTGPIQPSWIYPEISSLAQRTGLALEYQGRPAILFRLSDHLSRAELHVLAHRQTLEVLDIFQQQ